MVPRDLGNAFGASVRQQGIEKFYRHSELAATKRRGDKHFPQRRLPLTDVFQSDGADNPVI